MEVGNGYHIPGEASGCGCFETQGIAYEVGDDHFQKLRGNSMRLSVHHDPCVIQDPKCGCVIDCGFGPMPNDAGGEVNSYDTLIVECENRGSDRYLVEVGVWGSLEVFRRGLVKLTLVLATATNIDTVMIWWEMERWYCRWWPCAPNYRWVYCSTNPDGYCRQGDPARFSIKCHN